MYSRAYNPRPMFAKLSIFKPNIGGKWQIVLVLYVYAKFMFLEILSDRKRDKYEETRGF